MRKYLHRCVCSLLLLLWSLWSTTGGHAANSMAPYVDSPIFMTNAAPPNVLIIFDTSGSMNSMAYWEEIVMHRDTTPGECEIVPKSPYNPTKNYSGSFVSDTPGNRVMHSYISSKFERNPAGEMVRGRRKTTSGPPYQSKESIPGR
jgi:hypothetical protein